MKNSVAVNLLSQMFLAQFSEEEHEALGMAIDALNALPTHREESQHTQGVGSVGWIPCSERLPTPPTFCLVTTDGSHGDVIDIALYMSDGWHKASDVVAWMPLPEPYRKTESHEREGE